METPMKNSIAITDIPVVSKEVKFFRFSDIKVIPESDYRNLAKFESIDISQPLFSVTEGDRNYIYSFSKVFDGIRSESSRIKNNQSNMLLTLVLSLFGLAGSACFLKFVGHSEVASIIGFASTFMLSVCLWDLITNRYKKTLKNLDDKKLYVLANSQDYLKKLEADARKPALNI